MAPMGWLARNIPLPEPHLAGLSIAVAAGWLTGWTLPVPAWARLAGLGLALTGWSLAAWATWTSRRTLLAHPDQLVRHGPYGRSRNPMYVGWTVAYVGLSVALGSAWMLGLLPAVLLFTHLTVRREERHLRARFGCAYATYETTVPRYL